MTISNEHENFCFSENCFLKGLLMNIHVQKRMLVHLFLTFSKLLIDFLRNWIVCLKSFCSLPLPVFPICLMVTAAALGNICSLLTLQKDIFERS